MKLKDWALLNGIAPATAYRYFHKGILPVKAVQLPTGTILVETENIAKKTNALVVYARVSSHDQKNDLERQVGRVVAAITLQGESVTQVVTEIGSGMNGARPKLKKLLADPNVNVIVVEHRDRLGRFGVDCIEAALSAQNRKILVIQDGELEDDLVRDMTDVLTSFCARLYGRRSAKIRAARAIAATEIKK